MPKIKRYVSGEGDSLNADMIHRALGETTSSARIPAPNSQFSTTRSGARGGQAAARRITGRPWSYRISIIYLSFIVKSSIVHRLKEITDDTEEHHLPLVRQGRARSGALLRRHV